MDNKLLSNLLKTKDAQKVLATLSYSVRQSVLKKLISELRKNKKVILAANTKDIDLAKKYGKNKAFLDRLTFTDATFDLMTKQVESIRNSKDPLAEILENKKIIGGINLQKITVPLGVLAIIYESRPNVTIDVAALSIMSGNACILKGGSDVLKTNKALVECVHTSLKAHSLPLSAVFFLDTVDRKIVDVLVKQNELIDVLIPRGGYGLVKKIVRQSRIPILYHASGGARIYIDESANLKKATQICINAKTNRPATCNSLDCVVVHERIASSFIPELVKQYKALNVEVKGDTRTQKISLVKKAKEIDFDTEFLDYTVVIKIVKNTDEAIKFIGKHSKKHSEGIVSEDKKIISHFVNSIDAAGIFVNCSTRLHDGGTFGLGAEIGIATGKLHARGPVGLNELTTYKWVAYGNGDIRK